MKTIILTNGYPYGNHEAFIAGEMMCRDESSMVISCYIGAVGAEKKTVPYNQRIRVMRCVAPFFRGGRIRMAFSAMLSVFCFPFWYELFHDGIRPVNLAKIAQLASCIGKARQIYRCATRIVIREGLQKEQLVFYAYWMNQLSLSAVWLAKRFRGKAIARCHGYDVYPRKENRFYITMQRYLLERLDHVFPISQDGKRVLSAVAGKDAALTKKITVNRLGTFDHGLADLPEAGAPFTLISCSNVIPLKRLGLLFDAMLRIRDFPIRWYHFGDGELLEQLRSRAEASESSHTIRFMGYRANDEIYAFYKKCGAHAFVNVSESEGIPVSIMEALSMGIPCVATDVGGVREIVHDGENGWLLKKEIEPEDLSNALAEARGADGAAYLGMRAKARALWERDMNIRVNLAEMERFTEEVAHER